MKLCECKEWGLNGYYCEFPNLNIKNCKLKIQQGKINMQHEKKKMTRAEAIACILKHIPAAHNAAGVIDFYIEAGMLEIVEEKITSNPVILALCAIMTEIEVRQGPDYGKLYVAYPSQYGASCLIDGLKVKGYKIVKDID